MLKKTLAGPVIGIVGGIGPYAGLDFNEKIFKNTVAGSDQEHLRTILISFSVDIVDRTEHLLDPKNVESPALAITEILAKLESIGAVIAGIPCNTAHAPLIFSAIKEQLVKKNIKIELLNMIEETFLEIQKLKFKKVGLLATLGTYFSDVYRMTAKASNQPIEILYPQQDAKKSIHASIYHEQFGIKAKSNPVTKIATDILLKESEKLIAEGAEAIIMGCTEMPLALGDKRIGVPMIDPTEVLARSCIQKVAPEKLLAK